jgi:hypothetical protein
MEAETKDLQLVEKQHAKPVGHSLTQSFSEEHVDKPSRASQGRYNQDNGRSPE